MIMVKLIKQDLMNMVKTPVVVCCCTYLLWIMIFLFGFVFSSLYGGDGVTSYDYYGVSMMMFVILISSMITPNTFFEEKIKQGNIRIAFSPISSISICMSKVISSFIFMGAGFALNIIVMNYFNITNFGGKNLIYILLLLGSFLLFTVSLGGAACVIFKTEELTNNILTIIIGIFSIFSGVFFPIESLGKWFVRVSNICPLKWIFDITFNVIYDSNFANYNLVVLVLIVLSVICMIVMNICYNAEDYI